MNITIISSLIFAFGILGMIFGPLGFVLSLPVWFSLTYITKIVDLFSTFSFASLTAENLHWGWLIVSYFIIGCLIWWLSKNQRKNLV